MSAPEAKVIRDGQKQTLPARELVPGDIVLLDAGDYVPADGRILESGSLKINEGMLTGESEAAEKHAEVIHEEAGIGDRRNMAFSGSLVVYGRGTIVITGTALKTEIGKIAELIENAEAKETPLQRKLESFSKVGFLHSGPVHSHFAIEAGRVWLTEGTENIGPSLINALMFAVAVAVAAIPGSALLYRHHRTVSRYQQNGQATCDYSQITRGGSIGIRQHYLHGQNRYTHSE